ncbi:MAG: phosphatidylserine decarboxylase [Phycisphaerae bacterium]
MAPYARLEITLILLLGAVVTVATGYYWQWWSLLPGVLALALLLFYRDPPRKTPVGDDLLIAAADGRLMNVQRDYHDGETETRQLRFVIFLSVFNVHVNRSPCAGSITQVQYYPGAFLNALRPEATDRNENNLVVIQPKSPLPGPVHVRQIAGVLARRVVCALKVGDEVSTGQRFGMIKLGSQTEIRVPEDPGWEIVVARGDRVKAGLTVLARLKRE